MGRFNLFISVLLALMLSLNCSAASKSSGETAPSIGIGLNAVNDWSGSLPFLDIMKQARPEWSNWSGAGSKEFDLDHEGWVKRLKPKQRAAITLITIPKEYSLPFKDYIVLYEGSGEIRYLNAAKRVEKLGKGRDKIQISSGSSVLEILETDPADYIRNIRIVPEKHLESFLAGEIFNPEWLSIIQPFRALRFMDWLKTNNSNLVEWADRPLVSDRSWADVGVPYEIIITLANKLNKDIWINIPHKANPEYIESLAKLLYKSLDEHLKIYVEYSNEVWNRQFEQAIYAKEQAEKIWPNQLNAATQWYGVQAAKVCDQFKVDVFGEKTDRVKCVMSVHTAVQGREKLALDCPNAVSETFKPCYQHGFDYLAVTNYFAGYLTERNEKQTKVLKEYAEQGQAGVDKGIEHLLTGKHLREIPGLKNYQGVKQDMLNATNYWAPAAQKYGLSLVAYEGGQHLISLNPTIRDYQIRINADKRMYDVYQAYLEGWKEGGGELSMHYVEFATPSKWGGFGAIEDYGVRAAPKWEALKDFSLSTDCWWEECARKAPIPHDKKNTDVESSPTAPASGNL